MRMMTSAASAVIPPPCPASATPTSALLSAGASFVPSPTINTVAPSSRSARTSDDLSSGRRSPCTSAMPTCSAIGAGVRRVVARKQTARARCPTSSGRRAPREGRDEARRRTRSCRRACRRWRRRRAASRPASRDERARSASASHRESTNDARTDDDLDAVHLAGDALSGALLVVRRLGHDAEAPLGFVHDDAREQMARPLFDRGREPQHLVALEPVRRVHVAKQRLSDRQRSRLVEHRDVDAAQLFQRSAVSNDDAALRGAIHSADDRDRRRENERAGRCDDENREHAKPIARRREGEGARR